jgi:hypothetical protein
MYTTSFYSKSTIYNLLQSLPPPKDTIKNTRRNGKRISTYYSNVSFFIMHPPFSCNQMKIYNQQERNKSSHNSNKAFSYIPHQKSWLLHSQIIEINSVSLPSHAKYVPPNNPPNDYPSHQTLENEPPS